MLRSLGIAMVSKFAVIRSVLSITRASHAKNGIFGYTVYVKCLLPIASIHGERTIHLKYGFMKPSYCHLKNVIFVRYIWTMLCMGALLRNSTKIYCFGVNVWNFSIYLILIQKRSQ
uniref:Putative secreted peptide n=1 Tax=Anopheles braziliensis TaxID=58242 RepID=A0A2M3ZT90_9DIPT